MQVPEITIDELAGRLGAGRALVDVRQPDEYVEAHVPGAVLIPLGSVVEELERIRGLGAVDVICRSGVRSLRAAEFLLGNGVDAANVAGGTLAWVAAGRPVVTGTDLG